MGFGQFEQRITRADEIKDNSCVFSKFLLTLLESQSDESNLKILKTQVIFTRLVQLLMYIREGKISTANFNTAGDNFAQKQVLLNLIKVSN